MKILVLTCSTGGGHNACARYIKEEFNLNNIQCDVYDYLKIINEKTASKIENLYLNSTKGSGTIFKEVYKLGEIYNKTNIKSPVYLLNKLAKDKLYSFIKDNEYDLVICTHLFPSMCLTELNKECIIKFINIATDYECIPFWNETNPNLFVIPSKLLRKNFIKKGINKKILLPTGIPVSSNFKNVKNNLKLKEDKDIVLLTSGSMGFGNLVNLVNSFLESIPNVYLYVICGNNQKLQEKLLQINNSNLKVLGYINNINEYMNKSKIVITKPGGLTTSEVATIHKPLIHMMPIPGVENYNALFFENNKMSLRADSIEDVINKTKLLLNDKKLQEKMISNQKKYINENSALNLVNYIINSQIKIK